MEEFVTRDLTELQLKCLVMWSGMRGRNRMLAVVAKRLGVSRTAVQKAFHGMVEKGILDESLEPTECGWDFIDHVKRQCLILEKWMELHHVHKEEWTDIYTLLARMGPSFLNAMAQESIFCKLCNREENRSLQIASLKGEDLSTVFLPGLYKADMEIRKRDNERELSMADRAFEKPVRFIVHDNGYSEIELKRVKIRQMSPMKQKEVGGMMRSMEYWTGEERKKPILRDNTVGIPTRDIEWSCNAEEGVLRARVVVAFTCTAGYHSLEDNVAIMHLEVTGEGYRSAAKKV